jgi:hypothetical protein
MKNGLFTLLLCFSASVFAAPQAKPAEYNINIHVSASRMVRHGDSSPYYEFLNTNIDGKKYELSSTVAPQRLLMLGDYKARLVSDEHFKGNYDSWQVYEFQFPDGKTRKFLVVGQLE